MTDRKSKLIQLSLLIVIVSVVLGFEILSISGTRIMEVEPVRSSNRSGYLSMFHKPVVNPSTSTTFFFETVSEIEPTGPVVSIEQVVPSISDQPALSGNLASQVINFLDRSQNDGSEQLPSMDTAYFRGMALNYLGQFEPLDQAAIQEAILSFVASTRGPDGGYGNWKGAKSSMESTFQALQLLSAYGVLSNFTLVEVNTTLQYVQGLKTVEGGYFPLPDWDVPDITSSYRALWIKNQLKQEYPSLVIDDDNGITSFFNSSFNQPLLFGEITGYAEVIGGKSELLASLGVIDSYKMLNMTDPYAENVVNFLKKLITSSGGVSGYAGSLPTTGYTATAIQIYLILKSYSSFNIDGLLPSSFIDNATNYFRAVKEAGSGFTASERDSTAELSSTFFALRSLALLKEKQLLYSNLDLTGVYEFLTTGTQPDFGFGDYPGDSGDLSYTPDAIITGRLLQDISWINPAVHHYIGNSYDETVGGYGFRPFSRPLVKYTYHAIRSLRALNDSLAAASDIERFLLQSQNDDGGFGQDPQAKFSYLTHTYWGLSGLKLLGALDESTVNSSRILSWLSTLRKQDGSYSNSFGLDASLSSTYRAVQILSLLGSKVNSSDPLASTLPSFQKPSGGFVLYTARSTPTMESTYYGVALALQLGVAVNLTLVREFVMSLYNEDGGFGLRPGFSSRVSSTYHAILLLTIIDSIGNGKEKPVIDENTIDFYSPLINPAFIPKIDTNKSFQGSYMTMAGIKDPESGIANVWINTEWWSLEKGGIITSWINGSESLEEPDHWFFLIGTFNEEGYLRFRINALDGQGNIATTPWFYLKTTHLTQTASVSSLELVTISLPLIIPLVIILSAIKGIQGHQIRKKENKGLKMFIDTAKSSISSGNEYTNLVYLFLIMSSISFLARLFLGDALIVLERSTFLFRFLLGLYVVLAAKYVLGLRTLGLFAPIVLVISLLVIGPFWGVLIFLNIFTLGYLVRSLLEPYELAVGFRIGILMIFVICYIGLLELVGEIFRIPSLAGSILVPVIITPWFIDRYTSDIAENDHLTSFYRLFWTLVVSISAYVLMSFDQLVHFIVLNPETWVIMVGILLYWGKTYRYTLLDRKRFKNLFQSGELPLSTLIRNRDYIARYNAPVLFPVINKFSMKEQFDNWRVPTAEVLAIIENENQLEELMKRLSSEKVFSKGFVIKPTQSFGGKGIVVVNSRNEEGNFMIGGNIYHPKAIETEIRKILQGEYLTSQTKTDKDVVLIEEKISTDPALATISVGLPDVRVIVFRGIPVMSMARLPTAESGGKANLKQGAIGAAISMSSGTVTSASWKGLPVNRHPDTGNTITGFKFDSWLEILATACLAQKSSGLGYAGVDIVIDENGRVLVLEINKRPGLEIQNVNQSSLLKRLQQIEAGNLEAKDLSPLKSARMGIDLAKKFWEVKENNE
ncbi:MAG: sugar-transfer associated ATP-grasp domain-containing protein [Candidatus Odinarchaeota archaeon]